MSENAGRVFTEGETHAIVQDNVARETAALQEKVTGLETTVSELQTKNDALETEKAAAEQRATAAEQALTDYKAEIENEKAKAERKEARKAQLAEANPLLDLSDETDAGKARLERIAAMSDDAFTEYLADMREVASKAAPADGAATKQTANDQGGEPPRQTAAFSTDPGEKKPTGTVLGVIGARRAITA